jgi:hypothetical protein
VFLIKPVRGPPKPDGGIYDRLLTVVLLCSLRVSIREPISGNVGDGTTKVISLGTKSQVLSGGLARSGSR